MFTRDESREKKRGGGHGLGGFGGFGGGNRLARAPSSRWRGGAASDRAKNGGGVPWGAIKAKLSPSNIIMPKLNDLGKKAVAALSGTISGVLLISILYKIIGGRQDEVAEARREVRKQSQDRKARLADVRRRLSGPLRAAAKDLHDRVSDILRPAPDRVKGEFPSKRGDYFAAHYPDNPEEATNSTLFRLCKYLHWVEQFQRGVQLEGGCDDV